jgi:hypothetical protein
MQKPQKNKDRIIDLLGLLVRAPRTVTELSELTGLDRVVVWSWLDLMRQEGLISCKRRFAAPWIYTWDPPSVAPNSELIPQANVAELSVKKAQPPQPDA